MPIPETSTIYQSVALMRKKVEVLKKDRSGYGYRYPSKEEILIKIFGLMESQNVSLIPQVVPGTTSVEPYHYIKTKATKAGELYEEHVNEVLVRGDMEFHWVNNLNPQERIIVPWYFVGQQADASQSFGSGLSYASRYFLLEYFNCARDDDPDRLRAKQKESEQQQEKAITDALIEQIDSHIQSYLASHPKDKKKIGDFLKLHIKVGGRASTNYFEIADSVMASNLLNELKRSFIIEEDT